MSSGGGIMAAEKNAESFRLAWDSGVALRFARMVAGFWSGASASRAWRLTIGVSVAAILIIAINLCVTRWNGWFFNALEKKDSGAALRAVLVFPALVVSAGAAGVLMVWCREALQVRWREWIVRSLMGRWLGEGRFHRLGALGVEPANPEYRIADDVRMAVDPLVDLYIGVISSVLTGITFFGVLWSVGGSMTLGPVTIPGFMVIAALLYGGATSSVALLLGRSLVRKVGHRNEAEADLRFGLSRVRENASPIALGGGDAQERRTLGRIYDNVVSRWMEVVRTNANLTWITNSHGVLVLVLPLLIATPKYMAGGLSLGDVVQLASAFVQVQIAIGWFADNIKMLAPCYASARRIVELTDALETAEPHPPAATSESDLLACFQDCDLRDPEGRSIVRVEKLRIRRGETLLVEGAPGSGKTVLAMALAGLWPQVAGAYALAPDLRALVLSGRPYLPPGSMTEVLGGDDDAARRDALDTCGLAHLVPALDSAAHWPPLSDGERARLAAARALLAGADLVVVDTSIAAQDPAFLGRYIERLKQGARRPAIVVTTHDHPPFVAAERVLHIARGPEGTAALADKASSGRAPAPRPHLVKK